MDNRTVTFILVAALIADIALEVMKMPVPPLLLLLSGFCVRHIVGDTSTDTTTTITPNVNKTTTSTQQKVD